MKKLGLIILLFTFSVTGLFAQKGVRKALRTGNKAYKEQRYGAAQGEYQKALEENAASKEASFNLANSYYKQSQWKEALDEYQHYLTLENENPEKISAAWSNIGNTYLKKKANEKASAQEQMQQGEGGQMPQQEDNLKMSMEAYKNALRLNPHDDETRYNLAVVQKMLKDKEGDGSGGGQDKNKDQNQDKKEQEQDKNQNQDKQQDKDKQQDNQQQNQNQMSPDNIQQILQAIEQDEKQTQERVKQAQANERKRKNENNRRQNKDW